MFRNALSLKILIPLLAISVFSIGSFASTVGVTNSNYQSYAGINFNVTGGFTAASNGFYVTQASGSASTQPCTWANGGTCQSALVSGNWYYSVTLTITASASTSTTYTLTVSWNTGSGYSTLGTLTLTTPSSITAGQTMTFLINTALTSFSAPAGMTVTVA